MKYCSMPCWSSKGRYAQSQASAAGASEEVAQEQAEKAMNAYLS